MHKRILIKDVVSQEGSEVTLIGVDKVIDNHFRAGLAGSYGWAGVKSKM